MMIEALETRRFFSATLSNGVLTVIGTPAADTIEFEKGPKAVIVHENGVATTFSTATIQRVRVFAGTGNDTVLLGKKFASRASIEGGAGKDHLGGGAGDDVIFGNAGDDVMAGNGGTDYLDGNTGNDDLTARYGVVHGGAGTDTAHLQYLIIRSGVENVTVADPGRAGPTSNEIRRVGNQLIFDKATVLGSPGEPNTVDGPTLNAAGVAEIRFTQIIAGGALVIEDMRSIDITGTDKTGLVIYSRNSDSEPGVFDTDWLFLPTKK